MLVLNDDLIRLGHGGRVAPGAQIVAHRRFEELARARPDLAAVVYYDESLTYGELDARASALAARLFDAGVGRESIVGICLPRRLDVLIAVLGVLKAGADSFLVNHAGDQELSDRYYLASWALAYYLATERKKLGSSELDKYVTLLKKPDTDPKIRDNQEE